MTMEVQELRRGVERWTWEHSGWEERGYLGMSQIWRCPAELYDFLVDGRGKPGGRQARYCYEGYLHQRDMMARLEGMEVLNGSGRELAAEWDERFRGHTEGELEDGTLLEVKSVSTERFAVVKERKRAAQSHYEQVQMYMLYGGYEEAVVVYKCRETGEVWPIKVWAHEPTQRRLEDKARAVLAAVDVGERPVCGCGRHGVGSKE